MTARKWTLWDHLYFRVVGKVSPKVFADRMRQMEESMAETGRAAFGRNEGRR